VLATGRADPGADLVAAAYRHRRPIELFFRRLKCIVGCRHWPSTDRGGMAIQVHAAPIAGLLIATRAGRRAPERAFEMACLYLSGRASEQEPIDHIASLEDRPP